MSWRMRNLAGVDGIAVDLLSSGYIVVTAHAWDGEPFAVTLASKRCPGYAVTATRSF